MKAAPGYVVVADSVRDVSIEAWRVCWDRRRVDTPISLGTLVIYPSRPPSRTDLTASPLFITDWQIFFCTVVMVRVRRSIQSTIDRQKGNELLWLQREKKMC